MTTLSRLRRAATLVVLAPLLAVGLTTTIAASPASAADGCGTNWHKQSTGNLDYYAPKSTTRYGRTIKAGVQGQVLYCTRERSARPDQVNQSIHIGVPSSAVSGVIVSGASTTKRCMRQTIVVRVANENTHSFSVSGYTPGASVTFGDRDIEIKNKLKCFDPLKKATWTSTGVKVTAPDQKYCTPSTPGSGMWIYCSKAPKIEKVTVITYGFAYFKRNGVNETVDVSHYETDLA